MRNIARKYKLIIHDPFMSLLRRIPFFSSVVHIQKLSQKQQESHHCSKCDVALFSYLYVELQHRTSDMSTFFRHENHPFHPSLSDDGILHLGKKSNLLSILAEEETNHPDCFDVKVLDGAAVAHLLSTISITDVVTFNEYADPVFIPHIIKQLQNSRRVDVV